MLRSVFTLMCDGTWVHSQLPRQDGLLSAFRISFSLQFRDVVSNYAGMYVVFDVPYQTKIYKTGPQKLFTDMAAGTWVLS